MRKAAKWLGGIGVCIGAACLVGVVAPDVAARVTYAVQSAKAAVASERLAAVDDLSVAFEEVANAIKPSVVSVNSLRRIEVSSGAMHMPDMFSDPWFRDFFGDRFPRFFFRVPPGRGRPRLEPEKRFIQGLGTGVIVSEDGYILTNAHVVKDADEVSVQLLDKREFKAKIVGTDPKTDLAVLKIEADDLHPAKLGDSDELKIGQWVIAAGNPLGLSYTITAGIISATGRADIGVAEYEDFIQTDCAINRGNSGGPLVDLKGRVIGINTAILSEGGGFMGIGLAIPINMAKSVMTGLIEHGKVVRGWLGVGIQELNPGLAKSFGYEGTNGVLISDVMEDSPAEEAGLKAGDIILRYDGKPVTSIHELRSKVASTSPGTKVKVEVFRDGKKRTITVKIGELRGELAGEPGESVMEKLGLTVENLTPELADKLGYEGIKGVLVKEVEPFSIAARAGLRANDVILSIQGEKVRNVTEFRRVMAGVDLAEGVRLVVQTGPIKRFVFLQERR